MNVFAANQLEAADVLALARLDDDGVPPVVTPSARDGQGRHPIRPSGAGHVATGQAELIAAPGRARQQLTPALSASVVPRIHPRLRVPARERKTA
jgi:hypothetical protein